MPCTVNLPAGLCAKYLGIALKQRERALTKFVQDYGPNSATVNETTAESAVLRSVINELQMQEKPKTK